MKTANDAALQPFGGVINEDLMQKVWDLSSIPLPFTDVISKGTHGNRRTEWTEDELAPPKGDNAVIDGADIDQDDAKLTTRLGNFTQISVKEVVLSHSLEASDSVGNVGKLSYQIMQRQKELRRDVEASMLGFQGSVAGNGSTIAGISAGLAAQLKTHVSVGLTGTVGGFNTTTGLFVAPVPGTKRALSEKLIRDLLQGVYTSGGNTEMLMARPAVIRNLSEYLFTSTARVATLTSEKSQNSPSALTAYGSVNVFVTDFGQTVKMIDNRIQLEEVEDSKVSTMYLLDPSHITQSFLRGYRVEPLAKTGLSEKRLMSCEYSLKVYSEKSQGAIMAIDETAAVVGG